MARSVSVMAFSPLSSSLGSGLLGLTKQMPESCRANIKQFGTHLGFSSSLQSAQFISDSDCHISASLTVSVLLRLLPQLLPLLPCKTKNFSQFGEDLNRTKIPYGAASSASASSSLKSEFGLSF